MKKTSIFFLIFAVLLVVFGVVVKNKAVEKADEKNIELFRQTLTENGDFVETVDFSLENTNKININLKNTDVNIIGGADKNYVEVVNFNTLEYTTYENNRSFNIEYDFVSAIMGKAESGNISFNGVRDFVRFQKHNTDKKVNIYLAKDSTVKIFDVKIEKGNVNVDNITMISDFNITIEEGDLRFKNIEKLSLVKADIKKGNVILPSLYLANAEINIENGNLEFNTYDDWAYIYDITSQTGTIKYNTETFKGTYKTEAETPNGLFTARIGVGNVTVKTTTNSNLTAPETTPAETQTETQG